MAMANSTCSADSCESKVGPSGAKGMCPAHYRATRPPCSVGGCGKRQTAYAMCAMHASRFRATGDPQKTPSGRVVRAPGPCAIEGCPNPRRKRDWCDSHYGQWQELGQVKPLHHTWGVKDAPCVVCGDPAPGRRKYCKPSCARRANRPGVVVTNRKMLSTHSECRGCGSPIDFGRRDDGVLKRSDARWCNTCHPASREATRLRRYGVTAEEYTRAVAGGCAICGALVDSLHVDHDHACCPGGRRRTCGKCNRGLICGPCNRGLGSFRDSPAALVAAAHYLEAYARR